MRAADTVPTSNRGYVAGKKINGRKRFIVADTLGLLVVVWVVAACWQDHDGAKDALLATYTATPVRHVFADQGCAGRLVEWAGTTMNTTVEIVRNTCGPAWHRRPPRRWVVGRTLAWLTAHRRLARDHETDPATAEHMIRWAAMIGMLNRLTRGHPATRQTRRTFNTPDQPTSRTSSKITSTGGAKVVFAYATDTRTGAMPPQTARAVALSGHHGGCGEVGCAVKFEQAGIPLEGSTFQSVRIGGRG